MAKEIQNTLTFTHNIMYYGRNDFLKLANAITLLPKKAFFHRFWTQNNFLPWKRQTTRTNNLHHPRAEIKTFFFFSMSLGYHKIQIEGLEFLQRCGSQIKVNTLTGSYVFGLVFLTIAPLPPTPLNKYIFFLILGVWSLTKIVHPT